MEGAEVVGGMGEGAVVGMVWEVETEVDEAGEVETEAEEVVGVEEGIVEAAGEVSVMNLVVL
jgi:hypothetical protein